MREQIPDGIGTLAAQAASETEPALMMLAYKTFNPLIYLCDKDANVTSVVDLNPTVLATGAGATVDDVITALQGTGIFTQT